MKLVCYTNSVSAHQLPLAHELVSRLGTDHYRYVYTGETQCGGQDLTVKEQWIIHYDEGASDVRNLLQSCDVLMTGGLRPTDLIEQRLAAGKQTLYYSERWFKPIEIAVGRTCWFRLPGRLRMLVPSYRKMARRYARMFESEHFRYLPVGPWALADMKKIVGSLLGKAAVSLVEQKSIPWGYFVEPSTVNRQPASPSAPIRVLWVGRMLNWKRVDTIVKAVAYANEKVSQMSDDPRRFTLTLVGDGPEKTKLQRLATKKYKSVFAQPSTANLQPITFLPPVKINDVRPIMRGHDVYILSSNAQEGWGAALNEAMEEKMTCFGTFEAGASAALLPKTNLYHTGDWRALAQLLVSTFHAPRPARPSQPTQQPQHLNPLNLPLPSAYTPSGAADMLMELIS